jgi:hypothetical protein
MRCVRPSQPTRRIRNTCGDIFRRDFDDYDEGAGDVVCDLV